MRLSRLAAPICFTAALLLLPSAGSAATTPVTVRNDEYRP